MRRVRPPHHRTSNPDEKIDWQRIDAITRRAHGAARNSIRLRHAVHLSYAILKREFQKALIAANYALNQVK